MLLTQKSTHLNPRASVRRVTEKSTKRANQFDLKLTREKTKSNSRAYQLGFRISLTQAYRQALPIGKTTKRY